MKIAAVFLLALSAIPSSLAQNCTLCADGGAPGNTDAELPVPGVGNIPCGVAASLIGNAGLTAAECTVAQAAAFLICECATVPDPNLDLSCAFCADGALPTNPQGVLDPPVPIEATGGEISDCTGLVAYASTLMGTAEDAAICVDIQSNYGVACGCVPGVVATTAGDAATTTDAPETTTVEEVETTTAEEAGPTFDPNAELPSNAPSTMADVDTSMPTDAGAGGAAEPPPTPMPNGLTPFPTASPTVELTSDAHATVGSMFGFIVGMFVALM